MTDTNPYSVVTRIKAGDTEAYRMLFRLYYPSVLAFITGFVKDKAIGEDLAQDVFMKVWIYRHSLDETKSIRNYLFLVSRRHICNWYKKEVALQQMVSDVSDEELEKMAAMSGENEAEELRHIADKVIAEMPEKRRLVFILSRGEGLKPDEIAKRLGISPRTVGKHIELALKTLRYELNQKKKI